MKNLFILGVSVTIYVILSMMPLAQVLLFPINIIVTFMHEFGHAFFSLVTGGSVHDITLRGLIYHPDSGPYAAGITHCHGGITGIMLMGGYVGSAIFGNILLNLSLTKWAKTAVNVLGLLMVFTAFFWYNDMITTVMLVIMATVLFFLARTVIGPYVLQFVGVASLIYIIRDFNVGPTGDLAMYSQEVSRFPPTVVLMYVWLAIVLVITGWNVKNIISTGFDHSTATR